MPRDKIGATRPARGDNEPSRARRATLWLTAIMAMLLLDAGSAGAGTYVMRNCNVPGQPSSPMHPWEALDNGLDGVSVIDSCATGGGVAFAIGDPPQLPVGRNPNIIIKRPDGPRSQVQFVKVVLWYAARLAGGGSPLNVTTYLYGPDYVVTEGVSNPPPGSENLVAEQQLKPDTAFYYVGIYCGQLSMPRPTDPCVPANRVPLLIRGMEVTLREDIAPTVLKPTGSLLEGGPQSGIRTLTYSATDPQSGLSKVRVLLDDTVVATHDLTPRCPYSDFTVCPASLDETLQIDTRAVSNGPHRLTLWVQDAAGNERVVDGGRPVEVVNDGTPESTASFSVVAKFRGTSRSTLTVPYGHRVVLRGRLTRGSQPVGAGARLEVLERLDRKGAREQVASRVETNADGSFNIGIATNRPSRIVRVAYRAADEKHAISRDLKVRVRAVARMHATLRGRLVRFGGRVLGAPLPKTGKRVVMEGRSPGSAWTPFKTLRTDRKGRFSGTYRLRVRRPGVRLKVRAVVPNEIGYGYLGSRSRAVNLRVR